MTVGQGVALVLVIGLGVAVGNVFSDWINRGCIYDVYNPNQTTFPPPAAV